MIKCYILSIYPLKNGVFLRIDIAENEVYNILIANQITKGIPGK